MIFSFSNTFQKLACSPSVDRNDMVNTLEDAIKNAGIETELRNIVFHMVRNKCKPEEKPSQISVVSGTNLKKTLLIASLLVADTILRALLIYLALNVLY